MIHDDGIPDEYRADLTMVELANADGDRATFRRPLTPMAVRKAKRFGDAMFTGMVLGWIVLFAVVLVVALKIGGGQ